MAIPLNGLSGVYDDARNIVGALDDLKTNASFPSTAMDYGTGNDGLAQANGELAASVARLIHLIGQAQADILQVHETVAGVLAKECRIGDDIAEASVLKAVFSFAQKALASAFSGIPRDGLGGSRGRAPKDNLDRYARAFTAPGVAAKARSIMAGILAEFDPDRERQQLDLELAAAGRGRRPAGSVLLRDIGSAQVMSLEDARSRIEGHGLSVRSKETIRGWVGDPVHLLEGVWDEARGRLAGVTLRSLLEFTDQLGEG